MCRVHLPTRMLLLCPFMLKPYHTYIKTFVHVFVQGLKNMVIYIYIYIYEYSYLRTCTCGGKILYIAIYSCGAPLSTGKHSRVVVLHTDMFPGTKQTSWRGIENGKDPVTFINELPIVSRHRAIEKSEPQARDRNPILSESEVKKSSKNQNFWFFGF